MKIIEAQISADIQNDLPKGAPKAGDHLQGTLWDMELLAGFSVLKIQKKIPSSGPSPSEPRPVWLIPLAHVSWMNGE